jgi:nicotinate-nucleotide adenylyltransferase
MAMSKIGVMGGSFDPIHNGHLVAASEVAARLGLDHVVFVPAGDQWQKEITTPAEDRYLMTVIATAENPMFSVSRIDIDRDGPTYTVDTLAQIQLEYPGAELYFITGADAISGINSWNNPERLMELAHFVAVSRPGHKIDLPIEPARLIQTLEIPALAISSTDCRDRVRNNLPLWYLVPDGVVRFIQKNDLYKETA